MSLFRRRPPWYARPLAFFGVLIAIVQAERAAGILTGTLKLGAILSTIRELRSRFGGIEEPGAGKGPK